jgi:hypothetical protein
MDWGLFSVQWLHVLLGIIWFGNALVVAMILIPSLNPLPIPLQREVGRGYGARSIRLFDIVVPAIIVLGVIRGTVYGPINGIDDVFATSYGLIWLTALIVTIGVYLWGRFVIGGALARMNSAPLNADGTATLELEQATRRVKVVVSLELIGFVVIFTTMILMRFGGL